MPETKILCGNNDNIIRPLKSENKRILICALIILACGLVRPYTNTGAMAAVQHGVITLVYIGILSQWLVGIRRRFLQRDMKRYLMLAAFYMILLLTVRFVKYEYCERNSTLNRMLWYAYYISFTLVPVLLFMASLYMGKTNQDRIDRRWKLVFIPAIIVIAGIMTNDIHQLAFRFKPGMINWNEDYSHGILYYCSIAILALSLLGIMVMVFRIGTQKNILRHMWLTAIIIVIGILYILSYTSVSDNDYKSIIQKMYEFPEFACIFLMAFFESLVIMHLIPNNSGHETFFMVSSLRAGLTDDDYTVKLKAEEWNTPAESKIRRAEKWPVYLETEKALLRCQKVSGGHFYWMENVEELIRLNEKLAETGDYLEEERIMLDESVKLEESRKSAEEQNRLYDMVSRRLQPQLDRISDILNNLPDDEDVFRKRMRYAGILGAYVKRRSNMLLLSGTQDRLDSGELKISIEELVSYVGLNGISCLADIEQGVMLESEYALFLFELVENIIELSMPDMKALMVTFSVNAGAQILYVEAAEPAELPDKEIFREMCAEYNGELTVAYEDECEFVTWLRKDNWQLVRNTENV